MQPLLKTLCLFQEQKTTSEKNRALISFVQKDEEERLGDFLTFLCQTGQLSLASCISPANKNVDEQFKRDTSKFFFFSIPATHYSDCVDLPFRFL